MTSMMTVIMFHLSRSVLAPFEELIIVLTRETDY